MKFLVVVIVGVFLFLGMRHYRWLHQWFRQWFHQWKQSWEGVVVGKYTYTREGSEIQQCAVELCYNQTVEIQEITASTWKQIEIGDYLKKTGWRSSVEKLPMPESETHRVTGVLAERLSLEDEAIRSRAVDALGQIGIPDESVIAKLVETLQNDTEHLRSRAASVLGKFGAPTPAIVPVLMKALSDEAARVRMNAAWALGEIASPSPRTVSALTKILKDDEDPKVRFNTVQALKKLGTPEATKAIQKNPGVSI